MYFWQNVYLRNYVRQNSGFGWGCPDNNPETGVFSSYLAPYIINSFSWIASEKKLLIKQIYSPL